MKIDYFLSRDGEVKKDIQTNSFNERRASDISKEIFCLDSMLSVDLFGGKYLLSDIETVSDYIRIVCSSGTVMVTINEHVSRLWKSLISPRRDFQHTLLGEC